VNIEQHSDTWLVIRTHAEEQIEKAHAKLELRGTDANDTQFERGRIAALRTLLALAKPRPVIQADSPSY
jgi:hypothetical protein